MSVIFSAVITGLGYVAYAAASAADRLSSINHDFELSRDGEYLWDDDNKYTFVGFSEDGDFSTSVGEGGVCVGRRLGRVKHIPGSSVRSLVTGSGEYVILRSGVDTEDVFRRVV